MKALGSSSSYLFRYINFGIVVCKNVIMIIEYVVLLDQFDIVAFSFVELELEFVYDTLHK